MHEEFDPTDYSVAVTLRERQPKPWRWEIYCGGKPTPVARSPVFFESMTAATREGKKALAQFRAKQAV
jgi:hypothetical protein